MDLNKFLKVQKIGQGGFGEVFIVVEKITKQKYVAKISLHTINPKSVNDMLNISREININASIDHPLFVKFIGYNLNKISNELKPVIISEYIKNGSLFDIIKQERSALAPLEWDQEKKFFIIYGISAGMSFLHKNDVIHRDLKPSNILIDENYYPKIADLGLSKRIHSKEEAQSIQSDLEIKGTECYLAPEIIEEIKYTKASDVYAFGIIVYEIVTNKIPYDGIKNIFLFLPEIAKGRRPIFEYPIEDSYRNLIERCWSQDPSKRPTFDDIVEELKTNPEFEEFYDKDHFLDFIEKIEEYPSKFDIEKKVVKIEDYINPLELKLMKLKIKKYDITDYKIFKIDKEKQFIIIKNEMDKLIVKKIVRFENEDEDSYIEKIRIIVDNESNESFFSIRGITFNEMKAIKELFINSEQILLHSHLFNENQTLTIISIFCSQNLTIPNDAFENCKHLKNIQLCSNSTITITENSFLQFNYLESIQINGNEVIINDNCFNECKNTHKVEQSSDKRNDKILQICSNSYVKIGKNCFNNFLSLESIEISSPKIVIKSSCFNSCTSLLSCKFTQTSEVLIGNYCFNACHKISTISFSNVNYIEIGIESFIKCNTNINLNIIPSISIDTIKIFDNFQKVSEEQYFKSFSIQKDENSNKNILNVLNIENITDEFQKAFFNRMILLSKINYSGILPLVGFGFITLNGKCFPSFLRENFQNETLYHYLREKVKHPLTSTQKYIILLGITYGVQYLHSLKISITNLTINNIFLDENFYPFIFYYELFFEMKPIDNNSIDDNFRKDIYLYSHIAYELITGKPPNENDSEKNIKFITNPKIQELFKRIWLFDSFFTPPIEDIFETMKNEEYCKLFLADQNEITNFINSIDMNDNESNKEKDDDINKQISFQNHDNIIYKINRSEVTSEITSSPEVSGNIFIPKCIEFESKKYPITDISTKSFSNSLIKSLSFSLNSVIKCIDDFAFSNSTLQKLYLPASLIELGRFWCGGAENLSEIEIDQNNSCFIKKDNVLFYIKKSENKNLKQSISKIVFVPRNWKEQFNIPPETTHIESYSFYKCNNIEYIKSKTNKLVLDEYSFYQCENLATISLINESSLFITGKSFCELNKLNSLSIKSQYITFEKNWIKDCRSLEEIVIDVSEGMLLVPFSFNDIDSLLIIEFISNSSLTFMTESLSKLKQLTTIKILGQEIIFNENWNKDCTNLETISINTNKDFTITQSIFNICTSLKSIKIISESQLILTEKCFNNSANLQSIDLKASQIIIENECFSSSKNLTNVKISCQELTIGDKCFYNCQSLSSLIFIDVQSILINSKAFDLCINLIEMQISALLSIKLSENCFNGSASIKKIVFDSKKVVIGSNCFENCNELSSILFKNVQILIIGSYSFQGTSKLKNINIVASKKIDINDFCFAKSENLQSIIFNSEELNLGGNCFDKCHNLKSISFENIKSSMIGCFAFNECTSITEIKIKVSSNLIICNNCFYGAEHLQSVDLASNFITIGCSIFSECSSLKSANIQYKDSFISANAFNPTLKKVIKFLPK